MNMYSHKHIFARIALVTAIIGITCLAVIPGTTSLPSAGNDKINHILAFFLLSLLVDCSFPAVKFNYVKMLSLLGYGLTIELIQLFISSRSFSLYDLLADAVAVFGYIVTRELLLFSIKKILSPKRTDKIIA
ncbi:MAG: VanZ family protein [Victivallaceae bacterium]|nr:VanZ family protein [Victivallaceae bacterium]